MPSSSNRSTLWAPSPFSSLCRAGRWTSNAPSGWNGSHCVTRTARKWFSYGRAIRTGARVTCASRWTTLMESRSRLCVVLAGYSSRAPRPPSLPPPSRLPCSVHNKQLESVSLVSFLGPTWDSTKQTNTNAFTHQHTYNQSRRRPQQPQPHNHAIPLHITQLHYTIA